MFSEVETGRESRGGGQVTRDTRWTQVMGQVTRKQVEGNTWKETVEGDTGEAERQGKRQVKN